MSKTPINHTQNSMRNIHVYSSVKALSHDAIFLATCDAILLLGDVKLANTSFHHSLLMYFYICLCILNICHKFTSLKKRIALQVARKIDRCDRALSMLIKSTFTAHSSLDYLWLHFFNCNFYKYFKDI